MGRIADAVRGTGLSAQKQKQMLSLDQEFSALETKIKVLETENLKLQAEVNPLKREVDRLKRQVEEMQDKAAHHGAELDDMAEKLLQAFAGGAGRALKEELFLHFGLNPAKGDYYLDILCSKDFIIDTFVSMHGTGYGATAKGRAYLAKKGLL